MLNGRTTLIVEGEFLIALDIQRMLESLGAGQTLFARNAAEAYQLKAHWPELALAIVEVRPEGTLSDELLDALEEAGIAVVLITGHFNMRPRPDGRALPTVSKPIPEDMLASAIGQALADRF